VASWARAYEVFFQGGNHNLLSGTVKSNRPGVLLELRLGKAGGRRSTEPPPAMLQVDEAQEPQQLARATTALVSNPCPFTAFQNRGARI
jgi:hypothetical protein